MFADKSIDISLIREISLENKAKGRALCSLTKTQKTLPKLADSLSCYEERFSVGVEKRNPVTLPNYGWIDARE